jgi:hypothetical protein
MWQLLSWKNQVLVVAVLAIVLAWSIEAVVHWASGNSVEIIKYASAIATVITLVIAGAISFSWRYLWKKIPWLARKTFHDLNGTWQGTLLSTWIDPATMKTKPPIPTTIWIRQTPFSMSIKLRTGESSAYSTRCILEADPDAGRFRVWYSYDNQPRAELAYRSARHEGIAWLEMDMDAGSDQLIGQYYSSRRTTGDMRFTRVSEERVNGARPSTGP